MKSIASPVDGHHTQTPTQTPAPSFEELKRKYAEALAEWDATPPWQKPRWQVTPQGKALFFDPDQAFQDEMEAYRRWQERLAERYNRKAGGAR